jgi:glycogen synthase
LTGILNGIDESWDPRRCAQLAQPFAAGDWKGKQANSDYVRQQFGLALSRGPIFGLVARLVHQKGIDLVLSAADEIIASGGQIVVTGRGEPAETITDGETGFLFERPSTDSFLGGIRRAFAAFMAKDRLNAMRGRAMSRSFSWHISAACYGALYRKTLSA